MGVGFSTDMHHIHVKILFLGWEKVKCCCPPPAPVAFQAKIRYNRLGLIRPYISLLFWVCTRRNYEFLRVLY